MSEQEFRVTSRRPEDLASGRPVAPGESVKLSDDEQKEPRNKFLIGRGLLKPVTAETERNEAPKRDELVSRAKELGIEGVSRMRNDELLQAIAEKQEGGMISDPSGD